LGAFGAVLQMFVFIDSLLAKGLYQEDHFVQTVKNVSGIVQASIIEMPLGIGRIVDV